MLESNLIMHEIYEDKWELEDNLCEKVYHAISATIDERKYSDRIKTARGVCLRSVRRIGKYKNGKN